MDGGLSERDAARVDAAVGSLAEDAFAFLTRLVSARSTVGQEQAAQELVAEEFQRLGLTVSRVPIPEDIALDVAASVPQRSYDGRHNVYGTSAPAGEQPQLLFNGHIDVVPADDPAVWSSDPFTPVVREGRLYGRGAGDMKCGFAMGSLALSALRAAGVELPGTLGFLSVIEEECTGHGTLAAGRAGVLGDAVVLLEPTELDVLVAGTGVLWFDLDIAGGGGHAESADRSGNPVDSLFTVVEALRALERRMLRDHSDPVFTDVASPYNLNIGTVRAGDWNSSVPGRALAGLRIGFPRSWHPGEAERLVEEAIADAARRDPWLAEHPPRVRATGLRAEGYALDPGHPLVGAVSSAHRSVHGVTPRTFAMGSTTDARYYLNQFDRPALCYGPSVRNMHGADESVDLASIVDGARTLTRFIPAFLAGAQGGAV
ncbi:ArgE/DapE family deacylase [Streptomyces sp. NPDC002758]